MVSGGGEASPGDRLPSEVEWRVAVKYYAYMLSSLAITAVWAQPAFPQELTHFDDKSAFLAATGATAEDPMPCDGSWPSQERTIGNLQFSTLVRNCSLPGSSGNLGFWEANSPVPGCEIGINDCEDLEVTVLNGPVYAMGFEFYEPTVGGGVSPGCPATDSDFSVSVFLGSSLVGTFVFNVADDDVTGFVGIWSAEPFDRIIADELVLQRRIGSSRGVS
jgi:hypothetical protein